MCEEIYIWVCDTIGRYISKFLISFTIFIILSILGLVSLNNSLGQNKVIPTFLFTVSGLFLTNAFVQLYSWSVKGYESDLKIHNKFCENLEKIYKNLEELEIGKIDKIEIENQVFLDKIFNIFSGKELIINKKSGKIDKKAARELKDEIKLVLNKCYDWEIRKVKSNKYNFFGHRSISKDSKDFLLLVLFLLLIFLLLN